MFAVDRRFLAKLEPVVRRVMIVDPNTHAARMLMDIMKGLGAREVVVEGENDAAMRMAEGLEPGLIFTERSGDGLNGEALTRAIRRSHMACRMSPIIMITGEATAQTIIGARDAGVHEFLRKPFASADLYKRIENVAVKPRGWVEGVAYVGPDRRRFNSGEYTGPSKRKSDKSLTGEAALADAKDQAMRILAAALNQFDSDPMQATRAVKQQAITLKEVSLKTNDQQLQVAVGALEVSLASGPPTKATLTAPIGTLLAMVTLEPNRKAG
ncbi:response regulator [Brevundimonas sp.]